MRNDRTERLLHELPSDDGACAALLHRCAACVAVVVVGAVTFASATGADVAAAGEVDAWSRHARLVAQARFLLDERRDRFDAIHPSVAGGRAAGARRSVER
ncbi:MAG TPA: hypothetical protein VFQ55_06780 [Casimicrobiaceae bacterium]|jgi:hypothetical protein|nr:hypothetical protein [Casimicrobiaceae bacterium]